MKKTITLILLALLLSWAVVLPSNQVQAAGPMRLAPIFSHNMVLQRNEKICVYGTGNGTGSVTVNGVTKSVTSKNGSWKVYFEPMKATSKPIGFSCELSGVRITLSNVVVGDVFVASGQSNMALTLENTEQSTSAAKGNGNLRFTKGSSWESFTEENVQTLTAIGVLFAQEIDKALNSKIPVGIISTAVGASRVDDWTSEEYCVCDKYCTEPHSDYEMYDKGHHDLYKNHIAPITDLPIAGVLWYQGESNRGIGEAKYYYDMFENMLNCWRTAWGDSDLPFYTVQIMLHSANGSVDQNGREIDEYNIRIAQGEAARRLKNVTMCSMLSYEDTVLPSGVMDVHPTDKAPVAKALANAVLTTYYKPSGDYSKSPEYCGPLYNSVTFNKNTATVSFNHLGGGLVLKDGNTAAEFEIRDGAGMWVAAEGKLDGNKVIVTADVGTATGVRLGYKNSPRINLYNKAGYCASPFIFESNDIKITHAASDVLAASGDKHWKKCIADGCIERFDEEAHSGGAAKSCKEKAICKICGYSYGDYGAHTQTEIRNAVAATETQEGYSGDTYCLDCGRLASKGNALPTLAKQRADSAAKLFVIIVISVVVTVAVVGCVIAVVIVKRSKAKRKAEAPPRQGQE